MHVVQTKQKSHAKAHSSGSKVSTSTHAPAAVEKEAAVPTRRQPKQRTSAADQPQEPLLAKSRGEAKVQRRSSELPLTPPTTPSLAASTAAKAKGSEVLHDEMRRGKAHGSRGAVVANVQESKDSRTNSLVAAVEAPPSADEVLGVADEAMRQQQQHKPSIPLVAADPPAVATTASAPLESTAQSHAPTPDAGACAPHPAISAIGTDSATPGDQTTPQPGATASPSLQASRAAQDLSSPPPMSPSPSPFKLDARVDAPAKQIESSPPAALSPLLPAPPEPPPAASPAPPPAVSPTKLQPARAVTPTLKSTSLVEAESMHAKSDLRAEVAGGIPRTPPNDVPWSPASWARTPLPAGRRAGRRVLHEPGKPEQEEQTASPSPSAADQLKSSPSKPSPALRAPASSAAPSASALWTVDAPMALVPTTPQAVNAHDDVASCAPELTARRPVNMSVSFSAMQTPDKRPPVTASASERPSVSQEQGSASDETHPEFGALTHAEVRALRIPSPPPRKYLPKAPRTYYHSDGQPQRRGFGAQSAHSTLGASEPFLPKLGGVPGITEHHPSSLQPPRPIDSPERLLAKLPRRMLTWHESGTSLSPFDYAPFAPHSLDESRVMVAGSPSSSMAALSLVIESARGCAQRAGRLKLDHVDRWSTFTRSRSDPSFVPRS